MDKSILQLRAFFRITTASFTFLNAFQSAFDAKRSPNDFQHKLHELHKQALEEVEKENPDLSIIQNLLKQMEALAEQNSLPNHKFPKGIIENITNN